MVNISDDKHIFAAYANMAQHNLFTTINHIAKSLGYSYNPNSKEDIDKWGWSPIRDILTGKTKDAIKKGKLFELLSKHFPFIVPMAEGLRGRRKENSTDKTGDMRLAFETAKEILDFYRNYSTHYAAIEDEDKENEKENKLVDPGLTTTWIVSIREVKQRFPYAPEALRFIEQKGKDASKYRYCLWKSGRRERERVLSKRGLIFFLALFLEKKYIKEMLDKLKGTFCTYDDLKMPLRLTIIFETMAIFRIRLPRLRYDSERPATALAFDMLNELQRCPKNELFDYLTDEDQQAFYTTAEGDERNPQSVLMARYSDRFPTLALKYIDQQAVLPSARFQIDLGNYHYAFYDKKCIDGSTADGDDPRVRSLVKPLHGYGRLDDIEKERRSHWANYIRFFEDSAPITAETQPYITDHYASYIISSNRIGMYWLQGKPSEWLPRVSSQGVYLPKLPTDPKSKSLREQKKAGEPIVKLTPPRCFLSTYELPSLIFYHLLRKRLEAGKAKEWPTPEDIIKQATTAYQAFWQGITDGSITKANAAAKLSELKLRKADLPKKMQQYLDGAVDDDKQRCNRLLRSRLDDIIADTEKQIERHQKLMERIRSDMNKPGKRGFKEFKPGEVGTFLAHDIIAMQPMPTDGSHKLTSLNFRVLQASMGVYESADAVRRVLTAARLLSGDFAHPFLYKVVDKGHSSLDRFYAHYLTEKLAWLRSIPATADLRQYSFLARGVNKWGDRDDEYFTRLAQYYHDLPVELPRGLFAEPVKKLLAALFGADFVKGDKRDEANVSFLIDKYHRTILHDLSQQFYTQKDGHYRRCYRFFALLRGGEKKTPQPLTVAAIEKFIKSEPSLWMIREGKTAGTAAYAAPSDALRKLAEQVRLKLEKARAKNPNINATARIAEIIKSSPSMTGLSEAEREQVAAMALGKPAAMPQGEIKSHLESIKDKAEREEERKRLARSFRDMNENEKQLRRIRVNDIITYLMAKDILTDNDAALLGSKIGNLDALKLSNVQPIGTADSKSILEIPVPFSISLSIKGIDKPVVIKQAAIKLKNYGDFHQYLHESRLETLIPYLADDEKPISITLDRDELDRELTLYDARRAEVYKNVHRIEKLILIECEELRHQSYTVTDKNTKKEMTVPVANNFNELLSRYQKLKPGKIDDAMKDEMINIRNSFSHNAYMSSEGKKVKISTKEIGEIAPAIAEKLDSNVKNAETK